MNLCRLCGEEKSPLDFNIELKDTTSNSWSYRELIEHHSRVTLKTNKLLPQSICEECRAQVDGFADFSQKLQAVQNIIDADDELEDAEDPTEHCFLKVENEVVWNDSGRRKTRSSRQEAVTLVEKFEITELIPLKLNLSIDDSETLDNGEISEKSIASFNLTRWSSLMTPCVACDKTFDNVIELAAHQLEVHSKVDLACITCNTKFEDALEFVNHTTCKHDDGDLKHCCLLCDKIFSNLSFHSQHMQKDHQNESQNIFQCIVCGEYLSSKAKLQNHWASEHYEENDQHINSKKPKPEDALEANKRSKRSKLAETESFETESMHDELSSDEIEKPKVKRKRKEPPNKSQQPKRSVSKGNQQLLLGSEIDTFEKLFADELNGASNLAPNLHLNTSKCNQLASGEVPDEHAIKVSDLRWKDFLFCGVCKIPFPDINDLVDHVESQHSSRSKMFHCRDCNGEYTAHSETPLINHLIERHHLEHLKFCCLVCSKIFYNLQSLIDHHKSHQGRFEPHICLICGFYAKSFEDLKEHKIFHLSIEKSDNQLLCDKIFEKFISREEPSTENNAVEVQEKNNDGSVKEECADRFIIDWSFGQYHCPPCALTFQTPFDLFVHQRLKHPKTETYKRNFGCSLCTDKKDYSNMFTFVNHAMNKHLENAKFTCIACSKVFWNYIALASHYRDVHPNFSNIFCCHCGKIFSNVTVASSHFKTLNLLRTPEERKLLKEGKIQEEMSHICHVCARSFKSRGTLLNHVKTHEVLEPSDLLQCHICSKFYKNKYKLAQHMVCHEDLRSWKCKTCGQAFNYKKLLQRHVQAVHDNDRPFGCTYCEKRFNSKYDLVVHVRLHTGDFPYECPITDCNAKYPAWSNLFKHCQSRHKLDIRSEGYKKLKATMRSEES